MTPYELIRAKRDGGTVPPEALGGFVGAYGRGRSPTTRWPPCAWPSSSGLDPLELRTWTETMLRSGSTLRRRLPSPPRVDKHSTGGVGDKVSICLPLVAAWRGGPQRGRPRARHTGGTLDKLPPFPVPHGPVVAEAEAVLGELGLMHPRADRGDCPGGRRTVRAPRRDRDGGLPPAHRRQHPEQEARRGPRRAGARRESRLGRLHAPARDGAERLARCTGRTSPPTWAAPR
jgi:hypothetical protein